MANIVITIRIMPESTNSDLRKIEKKAKEEISKFTGETQIKTELEPIAFGLNALKLIFVMDEAKGSTEILENEIRQIDDVNSCEVVDVRRAVG